jgi:hypothetical protein
MAGDGEKTPPGSPKKPLGGKGGVDTKSSDKGEVLCVVREYGGPANWPMLTKTNYTQWSLVMKVKMQARNLWDAIEPGGVSLQEDCMALDAITSVVPSEMVASLAAKATALEAWNAVKERRVGSDQVQKMEAQRLLRQFENIRFNDGEGVDDFTLRLQNIVAALETVGETIPPRRVVEKLLRVVPKSLRQVAIAIQVTADLATLSLEDVSGRLRAAQEAEAEDDEVPPMRADGKLYLTMDQWDARRRERHEKERARGGGERDRGREDVAAAIKMTAATTTTGRAAFVLVQAGAIAALARGGASTVAFAATSPGSAPSRGRSRHCMATPTMSQLSCRAGHCGGVVV